ncbi:protein PLANT CADMIUM RESISTANCE 6-like [Nymphaea colorata]|nr:protein PLANT CADMIUM RESISTANCE 6-like [Nymphaea colorata]
MGRLQQHNDPNVTLTPPAPASHTDQAPPLYPQEEEVHQYPPAAAPYAAAPRSPCPFPPQQQTQPQTPPYHPHPPPPPHAPPQPGLAQFQSTPFPQPEPVQPAVPFSPGPVQCYQPPATYPASGPQQFNQVNTPAEGVPYQKPYVPTPAARFGPGAQSALWTTGLFDCFDDPTNALITLFFPCVTFGQVAEILDNGQTTCTTSAMMYTLIACCFGMPWILSCTYRTKLRAKYGLMESPAPDWITHCFCDWCAICQEYRELSNRGLDPGIGWHANMMLQARQQQTTMAPPVNQTMRA